MSDEFAKGYKYGNFVTNNFPYNLPIIRDLERFSINNFHQTIPFTGDPRLTAGYDKGVADMTLALKNKPRQGEKMTAQELMQILAPQPKPVAVNNNDAINAMRAANNTAGAFGNVTDNEASLLNMVAGGISNPMPRINEMRNNLATAGNANNFSATEAADFAANNPNYEPEMFRGRSKQEIAQIRQAQKNLAVLKQTGQRRILTDDEKYQASQAQRYLQSISSPVEVMPPDIDDLKLSPEELRELLEVVESPNFRGFPMRGGR